MHTKKWTERQTAKDQSDLGIHCITYLSKTLGSLLQEQAEQAKEITENIIILSSKVFLLFHADNSF